MKLSSALSQDAFPSTGRTCILVVEDEFLIRFMLSDSLRDVGYQVIEASNADEALKLLESIVPDLILSDVRMPGSIDGMGLLSRIKITHPSIPVIIASAHLERTVAISAGAADFVAKPYTAELIVKTVENELAKIT